MYCPGCGVEDLQANQFCRGCGADLRPIKIALERPDSITASAASARQELGRAVAAKIREVRTADELATVTEEVLPEIEKFLESPAEKRLRRMRTGTIISFIGLGAAIGITAASYFMPNPDVIILAAMGVVAFFIGLGFIVNGLLLTVANGEPPEPAPDTPGKLPVRTNDLLLPDAHQQFSSITDHTTKHLKVNDEG